MINRISKCSCGLCAGIHNSLGNQAIAECTRTVTCGQTRQPAMDLAQLT